MLDVFNFKEDFKRWVKVFYTDISSCVTNNGFASPFFNLNRGVRQGCPLSGLLFADDTTLFVKDLESVQELLEMLEKFRRCS